MLKKEALKKLLAGLTTADNAESIESLINDIAERDKYLSGVGNIEENENDATWTPNEFISDDGYKAKYEALQNKYIERFMNGIEKDKDIANELDDIEEKQNEDIAEDTAGISELFKEVE